MNHKIRVVWMDETFRDYNAVIEASPDDHGQLRLTHQVRASGLVAAHSRTIHIPLANVRWWGEPGSEVAW